jgi:hypothetical protein
MNKMKMTLSSAFAAAALVGLLASPVFAITFFSPVTQFEDDDIEFHIDTNNNGIVDVGDRLVGVAEFFFSSAIPPPGSATIAPEELTAVFDLTVAPGSVGGSFIFTPTNVTGAEGVLAGQPAGTAVTMYLDASDDLDLITTDCGTLANCVDLANNGDVWLDAGFYGNPAAFWSALSITNDPDLVAAGGASESFGFYSFCLDVATNNTGQTLGLQNCSFTGGQTQIIGGGVIKGGEGLSDAFARSDNDFQIRSIPEPSTLLLLGAGLIGVSFMSRRRLKK